jgi:hypothetical protein
VVAIDRMVMPFVMLALASNTPRSSATTVTAAASPVVDLTDS